MFSVERLAALPPLAKLLCWCCVLACIAAALNLGAMSVGAEFSLYEKSTGGTAMTLIALGTLLGMMAMESHPYSAYGLVVDAKWARRAAVGFAAGAGFYLAYLLFAGGFGVAITRPQLCSPGRWLRALLVIPAAAPVAVTQQIIFSGYLVALLRERHTRAFAVTIPAALFAAATAAGEPGGLLGPAGVRLFASMFALQVLLATLRLRTGSIVLPSAILAGAI
ncbi:MAG: CPBP family glutamic-type intramembrane protease, partial [Planctomycetota bacterium]